jgi:vacuolar protein sorting-associated protein 18
MTAEVQDFGFAESPVLYSHVRSPGPSSGIANGHATQHFDDEDNQGFFTTGLGDTPLEMFRTERAQLNLNIDILQLVISNNILVMASTDSKIYKIDLSAQEQIVGICPFDLFDIEMELQKKHGENKKISKIFLDMNGDHLLVNTETGETFYFAVRSHRTPRGRPVSRMNNIHIESVAWNSDATPQTTREILIGTKDGSIVETYLEISDHVPNARYLRQVRNFGNPITGLHIEKTLGDSRDIFIATRSSLTVFSAKIAKKPHNDISPLYSSFFDEANSGQFQELSGSSSSPRIAILPQSAGDIRSGQIYPYFAWITSLGLFHGIIHTAKSSGDDSIFSDTTLLPFTNLFSNYTQDKPVYPALSQFHILLLHENQLVAVNRLNNRIIYKEKISSVPILFSSLTQKPTERYSGIAADHKAQTYWIYSASSVTEIVVTDEDRDLWEIHLQKSQFTSALAFAKVSPLRITLI